MSLLNFDIHYDRIRRIFPKLDEEVGLFLGGLTWYIESCWNFSEFVFRWKSELTGIFNEN